MDKTARLKYAFGMPEGDVSPDDAPLMAIVIGVMSAVDAELEKSGDLAGEASQEGNRAAALVQQLPAPHPDLTPGQVLQIQLAALKLNDVPTPNHGIKLAYDFCTPESRDYLGCPQQLSTLFRDPMYNPLLGFQSVEFQPLMVKAGRASQRFSVKDGAGSEFNYVAHLLLQKSGPQAGCWLTDAIFRVAGK